MKENTNEMSAIENIMTRSSVRSYTDKPIDKDTTEILLRAAMAAPSAGNKQPWRFVVVDNRDILEYISENFPTMSMARHSQLAVIFCGDMKATFEAEGKDYWIEDVSASSENLLLAAHALGLGAVWCGIYPLSDRIDKFSKLLHLPSDIIPLGCICLGYPARESHVINKWNPDFIHYNTWD